MAPSKTSWSPWGQFFSYPLPQSYTYTWPRTGKSWKRRLWELDKLWIDFCPLPTREPAGQHQWLVSPSDFHSSMATILFLPSESWANFSCDPTLTWNSEKSSSSSAHWTQYKSPLRVACFGGRGQEGNWEEAPRGHLAYWQCFTALVIWCALCENPLTGPLGFVHFSSHILYTLIHMAPIINPVNF